MVEPRRSPDETRERLLQVADRLFYGEGIRAVGIDRLLAESGVAKASLYQHFASKDALIAAYLHRRIDEANAPLDQLLEAVPDRPSDQILAYFGFIGQWMTSPSFRGCPFINAAAEFPSPDHPAHQAVSRHRDLNRARLNRLAGELSPDSRDELVASLVMLYDGALVAADLGSADLAAGTLVSAATRLLSTVRHD
jgi:AcrR family transcriptional regulator